MKILEAGHTYLLNTLDGKGEQQHLIFVKREGLGYPFNVGSHGGTNVQEVLRALIDRTRYLLNQIPSAETEAALACMETALLLFEMRAARRHGRHLDLQSISDPVRLPTCKTCGHIGCKGHEG